MLANDSSSILGIRPSMAAVRDLTQTGSASDIPKDIDHFWERIRNVSRVKVGAGAIPKALEERAGELLGALFEEAVGHARATLDGEREEIRAQIGVADQRAREADIRREASEEAIKRSEMRAEAAWERVRALETELSSATTHGNVHQEGLQATVRRLDAKTKRCANVWIANRRPMRHFATELTHCMSNCAKAPNTMRSRSRMRSPKLSGA